MKLFVLLFILCVIYEVRAGFFKNDCEEDEKCIEIYQCPFFDNLLKTSVKPRPRRVIRLIREKQCGMIDRKIPMVCCSTSATTSKAKILSTTPVSVLDNYDLDNAIPQKNYNLLPNDICGPLPTSSRITSGTRTTQGEFPWMALLIYHTNEGLDFRCGGTIISERFVLTAAHCIVKTLVGIRLGEYDVNNIDDCEYGNCAPPVQDFYIEKFKVHPKYNPRTFANDIAVLELATPADFTVSNVKPICLPVGNARNTNLVGRLATVSGWGVTEDGSKSGKLLKVSLPIRPTSDCQRIYGRFAKITDNQLCAGGFDGKDSCSGDSGGPMKYIDQINGQLRFVQSGIVSYGPKDCGVRGQPAIYTKVANYVDWILDTMSG